MALWLRAIIALLEDPDLVLVPTQQLPTMGIRCLFLALRVSGGKHVHRQKCRQTPRNIRESNVAQLRENAYLAYLKPWALCQLWEKNTRTPGKEVSACNLSHIESGGRGHPWLNKRNEFEASTGLMRPCFKLNNSNAAFTCISLLFFFNFGCKYLV